MNDTLIIVLAVYPSDADHDYGAIERGGFLCRVVRQNGRPTVISSTVRPPFPLEEQRAGVEG